MLPITATRIDFSTTPLAAAYSPFFALLLTNVFTREECDNLITLATTTEPWAPVHFPTPGAPSRSHIPHPHPNGFRNCERILHDDPITAATILERILPFLRTEQVCEIAKGSRWAEVVGKSGMRGWSTARGETGCWRLSRLVALNPRLRFLRYGEGQFFAPHCDALYEEPGPEGLKSYLTVHVYLNDEGLEGGATRFWTPDRTMFLDVEPRMGQVLVFQQRMLLHSGEEVRGGLKYTLRADCLFEKIIVTREDRKRAELEADSKLAVGENKVVEVTNKKAEAVVVAEAEAETEAAAGA